MISIITAVALIATPITVGVPGLKWLVGPYVMILAATIVALALRLRQLAQEMESA
jgi:hypothetical protein